MTRKPLFSSLTRVWPARPDAIEWAPQGRTEWQNGDLVVAEVVRGSRERPLELTTGRKVELTEGDWLVGVLGRRHATLEATGTWEVVGDDGRMEVLTGGGVLGRLTSQSVLMEPFPQVSYRGHVRERGETVSMRGILPDPVEGGPYDIPTILVIGTSMSAGKTTTARILIRHLADSGRRVLGAKLTGAGHYRDILGMSDSGADKVLDFVDAGLPSTVVPEAEYREALARLLPEMAASEADVAVVEMGASPLEPYNGETAVRAVRNQTRYVVLCATDPYAVLGIQAAYPLDVDLVTGIASNTLAGVELVHRLCGVPALNLRDPASWPDVVKTLAPRLGLEDSALLTELEDG